MDFGIAGIYPKHKAFAKTAKDIGYDFAECCLFGLEAECEKASIDEFAAHLKEFELPVRAVNGMFPKSISLIGEKVDNSAIEDYLYSAFEKTKNLDYEICVLGSGRSRSVPEGYGRDRAYEEFSRLLSETVVPITEKYGKVIAIEPLSYFVCNMINTVSESMRVVNAVNSPSVFTLIDYFHVTNNKEGYESFVNCNGRIKHVHVASFNNRFSFPSYNDGDDYKGFIKALRGAGYDGSISIEAQSIDFESDEIRDSVLKEALSYLKEC